MIWKYERFLIMCLTLASVHSVAGRIELVQPYFDVETEITASWWKKETEPSVLSLCAVDGEVLWSQKLVSGGTGTSKVEIAALPPGRYQVGIGDEGGEPDAVATFEKLPSALVLRRVALDEHGVLRVDGKPFVPQCLYRVTPSQWKSVLQGTGFNTVHAMSVGAGRFRRAEGAPIEWTTPLDEIERDLDLAESLGLKVMFELGVYVKEVFEVEAGEENGRRLREVVSRFRRHPALLGYYLVDEPYAPQYARVRRARELVRAIDPDHPTLSPSLGRAFYYKPTSELCDIFMLSCYPVPYLPIREVGRRLDQARALIGAEKPVWFVAQAVGLRGNDWFPTPGEARCMVYQALARGVTGFFYFSWIGDQPRQSGHIATVDPVYWDALKRLTLEIGEIAPQWLTSGKFPVDVDSSNGTCVVARQVGEQVWVIAVNPSPRGVAVRVDAGVEVVWREWDGQAWREAHPVQKALNETIEAYGVRLWKISGKVIKRLSVESKHQEGEGGEPASLLPDGSFEEGSSCWKLEGAAHIAEREAFEGMRCLELTAPSGSASARSEPFAVQAGQEVLFSFYASVDGAAGGTTVDAAVEIEDESGRLLSRQPLVGPDERVATATDWDWMGRSLILPPGAARARLVLGTRNNPGRTRYDDVRAVEIEALRQWRGR